MEEKRWNPYLAGGLSGVLIILSVWIAGKYVGASTTFVRTTGMIESLFSPERIAQMPYFIKEAPVIDWQSMFVGGVLIGSLIAALLSKTFKIKWVPDTWASRFGSRPGLRAVAAFIGGIIAMYGARLADGCPSGHGLSGSIQLSISSFIALVCFFAGGLVVARIIYGGGKQ